MAYTSEKGFARFWFPTESSGSVSILQRKLVVCALCGRCLVAHSGLLLLKFFTGTRTEFRRNNRNQCDSGFLVNDMDDFPESAPTKIASESGTNSGSETELFGTVCPSQPLPFHVSVDDTRHDARNSLSVSTLPFPRCR